MTSSENQNALSESEQFTSFMIGVEQEGGLQKSCAYETLSTRFCVVVPLRSHWLLSSLRISR